jgi:hypothetical protein
MENNMEAFTGLIPNKYVGCHSLEHYSRASQKEKGEASCGIKTKTD